MTYRLRVVLSILCTRGKDLMNDFILNVLYFKFHLYFNGEICLMQKKSALSVFRMLGWVFLDGGFPFSLCLCYQHIDTQRRPTFLSPPETTSPLISGNCLHSSDDCRKERPLHSTCSRGQLLPTPVGHVIKLRWMPV